MSRRSRRNEQRIKRREERIERKVRALFNGEIFIIWFQYKDHSLINRLMSKMRKEILTKNELVSNNGKQSTIRAIDSNDWPIISKTAWMWLLLYLAAVIIAISIGVLY